MSEKITVNGREVIIKQNESNFKKSISTMMREIKQSFKLIGITEEFIELNMPRYGEEKRTKVAEVTWSVNGVNHYYRSDKQCSFQNNLGVINKVIEMDAYAIRKGLKPFGQVMSQYLLEGGKAELTPRQFLGIREDMKDLGYIEYKYKEKAKEMHPDVGGDAEEFKKLQEAYNKIKEELNNEPK